MNNKFSIFNFQFSISSKRGGFTVLESIVAIAVLSLTISGVFASVQQSLSQAIEAKDEVKAYYLAQEAVEVIRNKRDNNQLAKINGSSVSWLEGITAVVGDPCYFGKTCRVDATVTTSLALTECSGIANPMVWGTCLPLKQDTQGATPAYVYGYGLGWVDTKFKREIQIESINGSEIAVTVRVSWSKGLANRSFMAKTYLFNWIQT